jgi:hypothetical protein
MAQQLVYVGPFDEVDLPSLRLRVKPGVPVEVSDEVADALLAQVDNWALAGSEAAVAASPAEATKAKGGVRE